MSTLRGFRRRLAIPIARLILRAADLVTREQRSFNQAVVASLRALGECMVGQVETLQQRLGDARGELTAQLEVIGKELAALDAKGAERERALREWLGPALESLSLAVDEVRTRHSAQLVNAMADIREERARVEQLRVQLILQERRLSLLLEATRQDPATGRAKALEVEGHLLDHFYTTFEDHFRGSREEIKRRARAYLDTIREAQAGTEASPVVDVGCGRGEWLELLAEHGLCARGADLNDVMVNACRARGLEVMEADVLTYLRELPDSSVGAVTAFHILEHLPFRTVVSVIEESVRVLKPGGVAIFETPNPENLLVGACRFYVDPTHRNPLHPDTMAFIAHARGLSRVEIRRLHPVDESLRFPEDGSPVTKRLNELFFGAQDFAVVGYRV